MICNEVVESHCTLQTTAPLTRSFAISGEARDRAPVASAIPEVLRRAYFASVPTKSSKATLSETSVSRSKETEGSMPSLEAVAIASTALIP